MKKFLSCLLVASMCFGVLAGCGSSEKPAEGEGEQTTEGEGEASTDPIYFAWYGPCLLYTSYRSERLQL